MYSRKLQKEIESYLFEGKIIMILGPRQVGKTTLVLSVLKSYSSETIIHWSGDNTADRELLDEWRLELLLSRIGWAQYIFIDEAQKVPNIGNILKQMVDTFGSAKQIIITGSSSFHILSDTSEPLTGRKVTFTLFPISVREYLGKESPEKFYKHKEDLLLFGMYPDILNTLDRSKKERYLRELANSNLYRDILEFQEVKNSQSIQKLLQILALRIGSEISLSSIGALLGMDARTIERYIDLLEKSYILFRLPSFYTNKEKELSKMQKIYFYDVGIRNAILGNFHDLSVRDDVGKLWENFVIAERMKKRAYENSNATQHFWRTYSQQEIDLVEVSPDGLIAYECKWSEPRSIRVPALWAKMYPKSQFQVVHSGNVMEVL